MNPNSRLDDFVFGDGNTNAISRVESSSDLQRQESDHATDERIVYGEAFRVFMMGLRLVEVVLERHLLAARKERAA